MAAGGVLLSEVEEEVKGVENRAANSWHISVWFR
jgi:hypothetical protein